jgi:O-acetyl-ADP-ribose deacetylase (regulator of RNase III)
VITEVTGDLLKDDADILVNPVNCVGVMGKGLALQFKHRYPGAFNAYREACVAGKLRLGTVHVYRQVPRPGMSEMPIIIHFPTKNHWRESSLLPKIELGLSDLVTTIGQLRESGAPARSIAVPALGAGLGGLPWGAVRKAVYEAFGDVDIDVRLYVPASGAGR